MSDVDTAAPAADVVSQIPPSDTAPAATGTTDTPPTGTQPDPTPPEGATPGPDEKIVKRPWYQKKIAEQAYQLREAQRLNDRLLGLVESNRQTEKRTGEEAPKPENFTSLNEYIDAAVEYKIKSQKPATAPKADTYESSQAEFNSAREDLIAEGLEKYEDFEDVINNGRSITPIMANAVFEADSRVEIARFLCTNPKEAARISRLSPVRQVAEIARIEDKINAKPVPPKKPSNAPAPISPVGGSVTPDSTPSDEEDVATWMKKRTKQVRQ